MPPQEVAIHSPEEAARRMAGISVRSLIALLKSGGYAYTSLSPGARPWGRGRQLWGLTDAQIAAIAEGQARVHPGPPDGGGDAGSGTGARPVGPIPGWDGKRRLGRVRKRG